LNVLSEFRPVMLVTGALVSTLGVAMLLPALVDLAADNDDWMIFASSAMVTMLFGFGLFIANRGAPKGSVDPAGDADDGGFMAGAGGVRRAAVSMVRASSRATPMPSLNRCRA
jgi:Trk-type K+ transport system membrane component